MFHLSAPQLDSNRQKGGYNIQQKVTDVNFDKSEVDYYFDVIFIVQ
jgi:hypothetical protein